MMASLGPSSNSAVEEIEGELWHSCAEVGCPVYAQQFDPSSAEPPEAITILQCGTEFRVRMDEAFDDAALRNKSTLVSATLPAVPLSTIRGRVGGFDDVDDEVAARRMNAEIAAAESKRSIAAAASAINGLNTEPVNNPSANGGDPSSVPGEPAVTAVNEATTGGDGGANDGGLTGGLTGGRGGGRRPRPSPPPPCFFWLQVLSPVQGWALDTAIDTLAQTTPASMPTRSGSLLKPGQVVARRGGVGDGRRWVYRVVCEDGALVRQGLELSSMHRCTLVPDALVEISERRINDQGLARLRTADGRGWISEQLNPLSGHRGPVVELTPLATVLVYRVCLSEGALVRQSSELSSPCVRTIEAGTDFQVLAKAFSDHPASRCIPRLQLADGSGWVSTRLNRDPPHDTAIVEFTAATRVRVAERTEELGEAVREEQAQRRGALLAERARAGGSVPGREALGTPVLSDVATLSDRLDSISLRRGGQSDSNAGEDRECVVCLAAPRTATIVHGETGHIACCMECARVLKARGDQCPVCRMRIDLVIQHFWA